MNKSFKLGSLVLAGACIIGGCNKEADKEMQDAKTPTHPATAPAVQSMVNTATTQATGMMDAGKAKMGDAMKGMGDKMSEMGDKMKPATTQPGM